MSPRQQSGYIPGQGLPLGSPFGSSNDPVLPQVSGPETESRPTNTGWSSSPDKHLIRVGARQLERLRLNLADRDQAILLGLGQHRYLTTHQVQADLYDAAGFELPTELPSFTPYLRTKYRDLPPAARAELQQSFAQIAHRYGYRPGGPRSGEDEN